MKYIIEIEEKPLCVFDKDTQTYFPRLWRVKGFNSLVLDEDGLSRLEELNSDYINKHFGDLQDTAYQKGFEDGKWKSEDGCTGCKYEGKTCEHIPCDYCMNNFKNQWTAKQTDDCIKVGDEVEWTGDKYIVTYINRDIDVVKFNNGDMDLVEVKDYDLMSEDGSVADHVKKCSFTKTGRHFDIESILEDMRND